MRRAASQNRAGGGGGVPHFHSPYTTVYLACNFRVLLYGTECAFVIFAVAIRRVIGGCHSEMYGQSYSCLVVKSASSEQPYDSAVVKAKGGRLISYDILTRGS